VPSEPRDGTPRVGPAEFVRGAIGTRVAADRGSMAAHDLGLERVVDDDAFDAIYSGAVRARSSQYWTPVAVARRAAAILTSKGAHRVLDVGSGPGKFCFVGALTTAAHFTGVEHRGHLVEIARRVASQWYVPRVSFVHGDIQSIDWSAFDGYYFFNPFAENYFGEDRLDASVELSPERFERDLAFVVAALDRAPLGTPVVLYHGLGRAMPPGYDLWRTEPAGTDVLELWMRVRK
jgi:SAM-dependent methyltransferase